MDTRALAAIRDIVPQDQDDEGVLSAMRGSVSFAQRPFGSDIHRIDGNKLDINALMMAKAEYVAYMVSILSRGIREGLIAQHETALEQSPGYTAEIDTYQRVLRQTKLWNSTIIGKEADRVLGDNRKIFPNLLAAIYVSQVKILASVKINKGSSTVQITIPSNESFIHAIYIECARILFNNPLLIYIGRNLSPQKVCERNTNLDKVVLDGITEAIRVMLPVRDILYEYLNGTMLQNTVFSMGDDFEAFMQSPYSSRIAAEPAPLPPPPPPPPQFFEPPAPVPPPPPAFHSFDPPEPSPPITDTHRGLSHDLDSEAGEQPFDDPIERIHVPAPPHPSKPRPPAEDVASLISRRPDPGVSAFKAPSSDGSGSEIVSDLDDDTDSSLSFTSSESGDGSDDDFAED